MKTPAAIYRPSFAAAITPRGELAPVAKVECLKGTWGLF